MLHQNNTLSVCSATYPVWHHHSVLLAVCVNETSVNKPQTVNTLVIMLHKGFSLRQTKILISRITYVAVLLFCCWRILVHYYFEKGDKLISQIWLDAGPVRRLTCRPTLSPRRVTILVCMKYWGYYMIAKFYQWIYLTLITFKISTALTLRIQLSCSFEFKCFSPLMCFIIYFYIIV